jgi:hypothetical protein
VDEPDRDGVQEMQLLASAPPGGDETRLFEQFQMLHDAEPRHRQPLFERAQRLAVLAEEFVEQAAARRVGEGFEDVVHGEDDR